MTAVLRVNNITEFRAYRIGGIYVTSMNNDTDVMSEIGTKKRPLSSPNWKLKNSTDFEISLYDLILAR